MSFVWISQQTALLPYTSLAEWFCITEVESVYCAVRTESLYKTGTLVFKWLIKIQQRGNGTILKSVTKLF